MYSMNSHCKASMLNSQHPSSPYVCMYLPPVHTTCPSCTAACMQLTGMPTFTPTRSTREVTSA